MTCFICIEQLPDLVHCFGYAYYIFIYPHDIVTANRNSRNEQIAHLGGGLVLIWFLQFKIILWTTKNTNINKNINDFYYMWVSCIHLIFHTPQLQLEFSWFCYWSQLFMYEVVLEKNRDPHICVKLEGYCLAKSWFVPCSSCLLFMNANKIVPLFSYRSRLYFLVLLTIVNDTSIWITSKWYSPLALMLVCYGCYL